MAEYPTLKVVEVCRVAPPPDSASPMTLPLTFFDILWLRFPPVQRLFFYEITSMESDKLFFDTVVPELKNSLSLSLILPNYLPLAGNLIWPQESHKPVVEFVPGDGVLLTVAESDAKFHHLSSDGLRVAADYHPFIPELPASHERVAVIALQVTLFQNAGFCIGITSHHAILDGRSSTSFMKSWARISKSNVTAGGSYFPATEPSPSYDRTVIDDPVGLEALYLKEWQSVEGPNNRSLLYWSWSHKAPPDSIRGTFKLTRHSLQKLKQWVLSNRKDNPAIHISTFTVAAAYIWVTVAKAEGSREKIKGIGINVDARSRLDTPLPMNYFGNCVVGRGAIAEGNLLMSEKGVSVAAESIAEAIRSLEDGALRGAEEWVSIITSLNKDDSRMLSIAGSPRFEVYSTDFGWGKPKKVKMISIDKTGAVCLSDNIDGDGVEFEWVARRDIMENFATHFAQGLEAL